MGNRFQGWWLAGWLGAAALAGAPAPVAGAERALSLEDAIAQA